MTEQALHLFHLETGESHELETPSLSSCILWAGEENLFVGTSMISVHTYISYTATHICTYIIYSYARTCLLTCNYYILTIVGFDSGDLVHIDAEVGTSAEYKFMETPIVSIKILNGELEAIDGPSLWILYEGGHILVISLLHLFEGYDAEPVYSFKLVESTEVNDFLLLPAFAPLICNPTGATDSDVTYSILVGT